jgi:hypothetical protein
MELNAQQMRNVFAYIDSNQSEEVKKDIFGKLGQECFHGLKEWVDSIGRHNIQKVIDDVNIRDLSPYWEKLQFDEDKSILYLTGKKVASCACALGNVENPPKSLCNYCCRKFQEEVFGTFIGKEVRVEITESRILGGERCSTAIHIKKE